MHVKMILLNGLALGSGLQVTFLDKKTQALQSLKQNVLEELQFMTR